MRQYHSLLQERISLDSTKKRERFGFKPIVLSLCSYMGLGIAHLPLTRQMRCSRSARAFKFSSNSVNNVLLRVLKKSRKSDMDFIAFRLFSVIRLRAENAASSSNLPIPFVKITRLPQFLHLRQPHTFYSSISECDGYGLIFISEVRISVKRGLTYGGVFTKMRVKSR